jgi:hypothetical protein
MKTNNLSLGATNPVSIVLAILAALLVFGVLTGKKLPMISGDRAALAVLFTICFAMCAFGIGRISATGQWTHPLSIIAYILGALILLYTAAGFFGFRLPPVYSAHQAIIVVAALGVAKMILTFLHRLL